MLFEACRKVNENTHLIDDPELIDPEWFNGVTSVGICGATSTPKWLMERCAERVRELDPDRSTDVSGPSSLSPSSTQQPS